MREVVIVSACRTAIGRYGGTLKDTPASVLAAIVIKEAIKRAGIKPEDVAQVIMGEVRQSTEASNSARVAALRAGLPEEVPAYTVNRLCASAMQAVLSGVKEIQTGDANIVVVGGMENMSRAPYYIRDARFGGDRVQLVDSNQEGGPGAQPMETYGPDLGMGQTAENVAREFNISREDQDKFALRSQKLTAAAIEQGLFKEEIVPVEIKQKKKTIIFEQDEHPRPDTTLEVLAKLRPAFTKDGSVTAGNSCGRNDGAAVMVIMSRQTADELGIKPKARIVAQSAVGVSPRIMGIGPVPATRKVLAKAGIRLDDIDLIELNEAFASQALTSIRELGMDLDKVNVNGGAIALGHPLGCTGTRLIVTLLYSMMRRGDRYGLATLCVGGGQGMATIIERLD